MFLYVSSVMKKECQTFNSNSYFPGVQLITECNYFVSECERSVPSMLANMLWLHSCNFSIANLLNHSSQI